MNDINRDDTMLYRAMMHQHDPSVAKPPLLIRLALTPVNFAVNLIANKVMKDLADTFTRPHPR